MFLNCRQVVDPLEAFVRDKPPFCLRKRGQATSIRGELHLGEDQSMRQLCRAIFVGIASALLLALTTGGAGAVTCKSNSGTDQHTSSDGSSCEADADGTSGVLATSKATGGGGATASAGHEASAHAVAASDSGASATADGTLAACVARASKDSGARSECTAGGEGNAIAHNNSGANAFALGICKAKAVAVKNAGADATCTGIGDVEARATKGGAARGFDNAPPVCDVSGGGTAKVTSPAGNCKAP